MNLHIDNTLVGSVNPFDLNTTFTNNYMEVIY